MLNIFPELVVVFFAAKLEAVQYTIAKCFAQGYLSKDSKGGAKGCFPNQENQTRTISGKFSNSALNSDLNALHNHTGI